MATLENQTDKQTLQELKKGMIVKGNDINLTSPVEENCTLYTIAVNGSMIAQIFLHRDLTANIMMHPDDDVRYLQICTKRDVNFKYVEETRWIDINKSD